MVIFIGVIILGFLLFAWIMNASAQAQNKRKAKVATEFRKENISKTSTKVEDYLWVIKILKRFDYTLKSREGLNTTHLVLVFENPAGRTITLEQNNIDKSSSDQGKGFLISGDNKLEIQRHYYAEECESEEVEAWLKTIK